MGKKMWFYGSLALRPFGQSLNIRWHKSWSPNPHDLTDTLDIYNVNSEHLASIIRRHKRFASVHDMGSMTRSIELMTFTPTNRRLTGGPVSEYLVAFCMVNGLPALFPFSKYNAV